MASKSQRQEGNDNLLSALNVAIEALNLAKEIVGITPAKAAVGSVSVLLAMIRDSMANEQDYVDLGLICADICTVLSRGLEGRQLNELSKPVLAAIEQLTVTVATMRKKIINQGKRNVVSRIFHAKDDKDKIAAWRQDLNRILHIFNTELSISNHLMLLDIHRNALAGQEGTDGQNRPTQTRAAITNTMESATLHVHNAILGELPPPPRSCFGRNELIEEMVGFAENLEPAALVGAGGIGKTSIALAVLHHSRIEDRFGKNRRFIRCDQFPASRTHFLARLSKVIGAGIENPEDLAQLRPFLSSREMLIVIDNAESVLDPQGTDAREIYSMVDELCRSRTMCLLITSRITTVPTHCKRPVIPTLLMEAARDIFYSIHGDGGRSGTIDGLLQRLDFHALSITLLATTASHNMWDHDELAKEWGTHRDKMLQTDYSNESLAATIELSLSSPTFRTLGPKARKLLGVVAFFPQGVDKKNLDWLFPKVPNRKNIFDKFCLLSLAYPSNGYITMLAPIRDYLCPRDPRSSRLLRKTKKRYFTRLSVDLYAEKPSFGEAEWIKSEDVNVEYLLNVFISIKADAGALKACAHFMEHLYWHKPRQTVLGSKIEGLPEDHPSKAKCLYQLSRMFRSLGNSAEEKRLLSQVLLLRRKQGNDRRVAETLELLSNANLMLGLREEGIQQARDALEIHERLGDAVGQAESLRSLARLLLDYKQLDAAEKSMTRAINLLPKEGEEFRTSQCHQLLGDIYRSKGEREKAIHLYEVALKIASHFNWHDRLFWIHHSLAQLLCDESDFNNAQAHIGQAKSHVGEDKYFLGRATELQAQIFREQGRLEDARSEVLRAKEIYEELGLAEDVQRCRNFLEEIERAERPTSPRETGFQPHTFN